MKLSDAETIFHQALELDTVEKRAEYVLSACGQDDALRVKVERLLRAHEQAGGFLHTRITNESPLAEGPGTQIGKFKILEQIGEGGFGVVYMAEQKEPVRRRVALKIIKLGMDTKQVVARFEAERQALAMMDHPNIARVLDGGSTETGRPYFVMELVRGIKITDYCDENNLSTKARLDLFIQVCQAIQHAHQKGIIHRDIKPSNVLVADHDGVPMPKIIDFGIAKATIDQRLTDKTLFTAFEQFIGTPAYMSPEQARLSGLDIDTRSDIYSLGVLLYELLTGKTPFEAKRLLEGGLDEIRRIIREEEPMRPSTKLHTLDAAEQTTVAKHRQSEPPKLAHLISGDLDWIVMKCLEKDRTRRYETANGLAADLQRHLENEPVVARPPSTVYRFQKAWRRHKLVFTAGAAVVVALVLGITASTWQAIKATRARKAAVQAQLAAQAAQNQAQQSREAEKQERLRADAKAAEAQKQAERADANARRFGKDLYIADMRLAQQAWEEARIYRLQELLDGQRPERTTGIDLRGFEWYYWQRLSHTDLLTLEGGMVGACCVAFNPDGTRLATSGYNQKLNVWDASTGKNILSLEGHKGIVWVVAFSPDGTRLASGSRGLPGKPGEVKVWDVTTGKETLACKSTGHASVWSVAFSPDGRRLASGGDDGVTVRDATTGQETTTLEGTTNAVRSVVFSPDGKRLAAGNGGILKVWNATTGKEEVTLKGHLGVILSVAFSPDRKRLASADRSCVKVWDTTSSQEPFTVKWPTTCAFGVAFSRDGKRLATANGDAAVRALDATTGREIHNLKGHTGMVHGVAFSPDGQRLASAGGDKTVRLWDMTTGLELLTLKGHNGKVNGVAFSPDGRRVASACGESGVVGEVKVWDATTGREVLSPVVPNRDTYRPYITSVAFSPDDKFLAAGVTQHVRPTGDFVDGEVLIWDAVTGQARFALIDTHHVNGVAFSPDGNRLASACLSGTLKIWDTTTGREICTLKGHTGPVNSVAFSPDGKRVASASDDQTVRIWDVTTGQEVLTLKGHTDRVYSVAFSPDGTRLASVSQDGTLKVWEAARPEQVAAWQKEEQSTAR